MSASATIPKSRGPRMAARMSVKTSENARSPQFIRNAHFSELLKEPPCSLMARPSGGADLVLGRARGRGGRGGRLRIAGEPVPPLAPHLAPGGRAGVRAAPEHREEG